MRHDSRKRDFQFRDVFEIYTAVSTPEVIEVISEAERDRVRQHEDRKTSTASFVVKSIGTIQLLGTVNSPAAPFGLSGSGSFNLAPKTETSIRLTFTPTSTTQALGADRVVSSNAVDHSIVRIKLRGQRHTVAKVYESP
jgi:hypothetical protein